MEKICFSYPVTVTPPCRLPINQSRDSWGPSDPICYSLVPFNILVQPNHNSVSANDYVKSYMLEATDLFYHLCIAVVNLQINIMRRIHIALNPISPAGKPNAVLTEPNQRWKPVSKNAPYATYIDVYLSVYAVDFYGRNSILIICVYCC